jgi:dTMP kinase
MRRRMSTPMSAPDLHHLRGQFIVFDGGEGCGKSTQARLLREELERQNVPVLPVHDPGATRIGEMIRAILLNPDNAEMTMRCEMLLYMASRAQMMVEKILPALKAGQAVVSDRFVSSTLAYQLGGDGLTAEEIRRVADIAIQSRWPDLTLIFDLPVEASQARVRPKFTLFPDDPNAGLDLDRIEKRSLAYHDQVRRNYLEQVKLDPQHYRVIDANRPIEPVHQDVIRAVSGLT